MASIVSQPLIPKVLIADDSETFLTTLKQFLISTCRVNVVATAVDGFQALAAFAKHQPDLAILDICMPVLSGLRVASELRRRSPDVRIILISIAAGRTPEIESLIHGADVFVPKIGIQARLAAEIDRLFPGRDTGPGSGGDA